MGRIKVKKNKEEPETKEVLAEAVVRISDAITRLKKSGLNEDAIIVLVHSKTFVKKGDIRAVFRALRQLRGWYCR